MQKRHRIFIAINLPSEIRNYLAKFQQTWADIPAKWTPKDNLHVTLVFLGEVNDLELGEVCQAVKEVVQRHSSFDITLQKVAYGPEGKLPPRYIWAGGAKSAQLSELKKDLEDALLEKVHFVPEKRGFTPHITMARISAFEWRQIEPEERTEVNESIDLTFNVESIEVMESEMKKGGPAYTVIESHQLQ